MAMSYRAWTFDPTAFHRWLDARVIVEGEYSPAALREAAMEVARLDAPAVVEYLECLSLHRHDAEAWENTFHNEVAEQEADWYAIAMAGHLVPAPRLSMATYGRMQWLLPMARIGWGAGRTDRLLKGLSLRWLVEGHGHESLHSPLGWQLRTVEVNTGSGGGWLSPGLVKRYRGLLDQPPRGVPEVDLAAFDASLEEITAMLDTAIARNAALRMVVAV